jgi:hypothetical protein
VCAGAQPYLGARIVSGDEMIDGVLSPRGLRPLGLWRPASAECAGGGSIAGAGRKGIGVMMGKRTAISLGGSVDELRSGQVGRGGQASDQASKRAPGRCRSLCSDKSLERHPHPESFAN